MIIYNLSSPTNNTKHIVQPTWVRSGYMLCDYCGMPIFQEEDIISHSIFESIKTSMPFFVYHEDAVAKYLGIKKIDIRCWYNNQPEFHYCTKCDFLMLKYGLIGEEHKYITNRLGEHLTKSEEFYDVNHLAAMSRYRVAKGWMNKKSNVISKKPESVGLFRYEK